MANRRNRERVHGDRQTVLVNQFESFMWAAAVAEGLTSCSPIVRPIEANSTGMAKSVRRHCVVESDGIDNGTRVGVAFNSKNKLTAARLGVSRWHLV